MHGSEDRRKIKTSLPLPCIRSWWDLLKEVGPLYGYFPNSSKTHILTKHDAAESAKEILKDTGIAICTEGRGYLGGAIGSTSFIEQFVRRKVQEWVDEIETLSDIAKTQPHAAYAAFTPA